MAKCFAFGRGASFGMSLPIALACVLAVMLAPSSQASLTGTVPTGPSQTVFPGLVPPGTDPGTLLASQVQDWTFTNQSGTTSGTLDSAVFQEAGGTLDFYYQVENDPTSATAIARETNDNFSGASSIATGFRVDGSSLPGGIFVDGTVVPITADLNGDGSVVGFSFNPPDGAKIAPGMTSFVLVISTDATQFTNGDASVIDGGVATVLAFEPGGAVPEPGSFFLLGGGLLALAGISRRLRRS